MLLKICLFKLQRYYAQKPKSSNYIVVQFDNKLIENVTLAYIMNSKDIKKLFLHQSANMSSPKISYSYTRTIRSQILNYRQTFDEIGKTNVVCKCQNYPNRFINNTYGHTYTSNLDIISNTNLKKLLHNGVNYRDQQPPCKDTALRCITLAIDKYIKKINDQINKPV